MQRPLLSILQNAHVGQKSQARISTWGQKQVSQQLIRHNKSF